MKVPWFGLIHDGAPNAFTYGHHPNNMRIVITQGILDLLEPEEVEGVVAHEIGHGKNWDMLLMTVVQLVPLLLYFLYRTALQVGRPGQGQRLPDRGRGRGVCPLHRERVYRALVQPLPRVLRRPLRRQRDRQSRLRWPRPWSRSATAWRPAASRALRKSRKRPRRQEGQEAEERSRAGLRHRRHRRPGYLRPQGRPWRWSPARRRSGSTAPVRAARRRPSRPSVSKENLKSAMQWDLWNPWATFYELNSTHPLIAHRLQYLSDQAAAMGQEPYIVFDRRKPESYWDDFAVDVAVMFLPLLLFLVGLGVAVALGGGVRRSAFCRARPTWALRACMVLFGLPLLGLGIGSLDQDHAGLSGRLLRAPVGRGALAQGEGLERSPGAGPAARHDHRPGACPA